MAKTKGRRYKAEWPPNRVYKVFMTDPATGAVIDRAPAVVAQSAEGAIIKALVVPVEVGPDASMGEAARFCAKGVMPTPLGRFPVFAEPRNPTLAELLGK